MLPYNQETEKCTGCTACMAVCPQKCITMEMDNEGFFYPIVSDNCIKCGKCERVCPIQKQNGEVSKFKKKAFAALTKEKSIWNRSTSGGAFSEICRAWGDENTIVCGACWENLNVVHKCIVGVENIEPLRKSKYVASDMRGCFSEINSYLSQGKRVIFSGTPCQVAGLKNYLQRDYDNLLLIDLICHGVGSPLVFQECLMAIGNQVNGIIKSYEFRAKRGYEKFDFGERERREETCVYLRNDQYVQLFLNQNCLRPSCGGNCIFRTENRQGDVTLADFKGLTKVFPQLLGTKYNYSTIVINSEKSLKLVDKLAKNMMMFECSIDDVKEYNPLFYKQTEITDYRSAFFLEFNNNPTQTIKKWTKPALVTKVSLKRKIFCKFPKPFRKLAMMLFRVIGKDFELEASSCSYSKICYDEIG